ncbi:MAG TPA: DUF3343 domain-containing protein [Candidatus Aphodovivens avistercoris]|nr:DUF3343 domain-containing protein [Candidatus Aphodovivens avistercoris]
MAQKAYLVAFESTHAALAADKALSAAGVAHLTIPVPAAVRAGCGIALKFEAESPDAALAALAAAGCPTDAAALYLQTGPGAFEPQAAF